jgi:DNA-binding beta-propeller fold protein YncE
MFRRPHSIYVNPYDPEKHVWVVDDFGHAVYKFSNDGKRLVQTFGTPGEPGEDPAHFARPAALWWQPDSTLLVADGYINSRVVKFDARGKYLTAWGQKGNAPTDTRPGYFNEVHGIATDPDTRRIFVNDRLNRRIQVFDENGTFLDQWPIGDAASSEALVVHLSNDRFLWVVDRLTSRIVKYDLEGHLLYAWGSSGEWPGGMWGVHGLSVDSSGNLYVAEVDNGRVQKYRPRAGANPDYLIGGPALPR